MQTTAAAALLKMSPAQAAYALALSDLEAAKAAAEQAKRDAGVSYDDCDTDEKIDAMSAIEGQCEDAAGVSRADRALYIAEQGLIAWGIEHACKFSPENAATLRDLQRRTLENVVARKRVVAQCFRLAA